MELKRIIFIVVIMSGLGYEMNISASAFAHEIEDEGGSFFERGGSKFSDRAGTNTFTPSTTDFGSTTTQLTSSEIKQDEQLLNGIHEAPPGVKQPTSGEPVNINSDFSALEHHDGPPEKLPENGQSGKDNSGAQEKPADEETPGFTDDQINKMSDDDLVDFDMEKFDKDNLNFETLQKAHDNFKGAVDNVKEISDRLAKEKEDLKQANNLQKDAFFHLQDVMKAITEKGLLKESEKIDDALASFKAQLDKMTLKKGRFARKADPEKIKELEDNISFLKEAKKAENIEKSAADSVRSISKKVDASQVELNAAKEALSQARNEFKQAIENMSSTELVVGSKTGSSLDKDAPEDETEAAEKQQAQLKELDDAIKSKEDEIDTLKRIAANKTKAVKEAQAEISKLETKRTDMLATQQGTEAFKSLEGEIREAKVNLENLEKGEAKAQMNVEKAEEEKEALIQEKSSLVKDDVEGGVNASVRRLKIRQDISKKLNKTIDKFWGKKGEKGVFGKARDYLHDHSAGEITMDAVDGIYTGVVKVNKWAWKKAKKFIAFLWEQLKIGFAFMIPGDIVATIQAAYQNAAMYSMITAKQVFGGINMWIVRGLVSKQDPTNCVPCYASTNDPNQYTSPNTRFFMPFDSYGNIAPVGTWLGMLGGVSNMIEITTGLVFNSTGNASMYGFPAIPLKTAEKFSYSATLSGNTISTVLYDKLGKIVQEISGGTGHEVKVDGMLEGFQKINASPAGNDTVASLFRSSSNQPLPIAFDSTLSAFKQGIASSVFGMHFKQVEGLGLAAYLLSHYQTIFDLESRGKKVDMTTPEMQLITKLAEGMTVEQVNALAKGGTIRLDPESSFDGIDPTLNMLLGNVFVYQTDDTPIVGMMKQAMPAGLKELVHDYVVGVDESNTITPLLIPAVNIPSGATSAGTPAVLWTINPNVAYIVSMVSGATYAPGGIVLLNNGITDYTLANTIWGQITPTTGGSGNYLYGQYINGFTNQLTAMQQLAQCIVDKGPFYLNSRYKAYRVEGLEDMYDSRGLTNAQIDTAKKDILLGLSAEESGAAITSSDTVDIETKKSYVKNGIFIYRIDDALTGPLIPGTNTHQMLPDYVIPIMEDANGNYLIIPLGSQVVAEKGSTNSFVGSVSNQVAALLSLVTSRVYDASYTPLAKEVVTNIFFEDTSGTPIACDTTQVYDKGYTCPNGFLVVPDGQNQPLATAFMETEFNPAVIQASGNGPKAFTVPPYHFLMMSNYDIALMSSSNAGSTTGPFGNVGTLGTPTALGEKLSNILPEALTGIPWSSKISANLHLYEKYLKGYQSPVSAIAGVTPSNSTKEDKIKHQILTNVKSVVQPNVMSPTDYTIAQVHDLWKGNLLEQKLKSNAPDAEWLKQLEMGPYNITPNWSISLLNEQCLFTNHYIYTLTNTQTSTNVNGLWVLAQLNGYQTPILESSLTPLNPTLENINKEVVKINEWYFIGINLPSNDPVLAGMSKNLQQAMVNFYNLQPRSNGLYYGIAPTMTDGIGNLVTQFVGIGRNYVEDTPKNQSNAFIDLLSGRVMIMSQDANQNLSLLPLVNIQGYEITLDPKVILSTFANGTLDESLKVYIQRNMTGFIGNSYTQFFGTKPLELDRVALNSGNYIYKYVSSNQAKPIDFITPIQLIENRLLFNLPLETDINTMISLVDFQQIMPYSSPGSASTYLGLPNVSTPQQRINYSFFDSTTFFNFALLPQSFTEAIQTAKKTAFDAIPQTSVVPPSEPVNEDLINQNAVINYEENAEYNKIYFDPTTLSKNNQTHEGNGSDTAYSGNYYLFNDGASNYFLGIGAMAGLPDSPLFDTYYCFSLQGYYAGNSTPFPLTNVQAPVGGYFSKNSSGKFVLTQVVFGSTAQHIASTYGVYINPKDGTQKLSVPIPVKSLFMDEATDMNLQGGKNTGTYMRFIKQLPSVFSGNTYYLYENIAVPGFIGSNNAIGVKMTPSAYLVQINPSVGPVYYLDLITGLTYDIKGQPLPQQTNIYKRSDQSAPNFNPLVTWGSDASLNMLIPFTDQDIITSLSNDNLATPGQQELFVVYGTNLKNITYNYQDPVTNTVYSYSRTTTPGGAIDGNVYQYNTATNTLVNTWNTVQLSPDDQGSDPVKLVELSNSNMLIALQDAASKNYKAVSTVYTMQPFDLDINTNNGILLLPTVTATYNIGAAKWEITYTVTSPTTSITSTITENYFAYVDSNNNPLYKGTLLQGIGLCPAKELQNTPINIQDLSTQDPTNFSMVQQGKNLIVLYSLNSTTNQYDIPQAVIAGGTLFTPGQEAGNFVNNNVNITISYNFLPATPFMPTFIDPIFSKNVSVGQLLTVTAPSMTSGINFNNYFFTSSTAFIFAPTYASIPQENFTDYYLAWQMEPQISTEGTIVLANYLDIPNLIPITSDKVFVDLNATLGNSGLTISTPITLEEYLKARYDQMLAPLARIQQDLEKSKTTIQDAINKVLGNTNSAPTNAVPVKNPLGASGLSKGPAARNNTQQQKQKEAIKRATMYNDLMAKEVHNKFGNTVWGPIFSAMPPAEDAANARLFYDPTNNYVLYKIGAYNSNYDFYTTTGITEGYVLWPMLYKDKGQGVPLEGLVPYYRVSGIFFDIDGRPFHETSSMKDLNKLEASVGNLGTIQQDRQSKDQIIFDVNIKLPKPQDGVADAVFTSTSSGGNTQTPPDQGTQTVIDNS